MRGLFTRDVAAGAFLVLLPFLVLPLAGDMPVQFDFPKLVAVFLAGNFVLASFFFRVDPIFALIHGGIALSTVLTGFGSPQLYFLAFWTAAAAFGAWFSFLSEVERARVLGFVVLSGVLVAAHCYVQVLWHDPILQYAPGINPHLPISFLRQQTLMGAFLAPVCAMSYAMGYRKCFLFMMPILFLAHSYFTILALLAGLCAVMIDSDIGRSALPWLSLPASVVVLVVYLVRPQTFWSHGRVEVWESTLSWWWHHAKWIGSGGGSFRVLFSARIMPDGSLAGGIQPPSTYSHGSFWQAHNDYIQCLFEFGLMGGTVLVLTIISIFQSVFLPWGDWNEGKPKSIVGCQAILFGLMANALGNFPWQLAPHMLLGVMSLAVVLRWGSDYERMMK